MVPTTTSAVYGRLINEKRRRKSKGPKDRNLALQAASDKGRLLFSASFRRLQLKTQAFPQEWNAAVRTRLTHSLEVASVGRYIAEGVVDKLLSGKFLGSKANIKTHHLANALITFVEVACLMHDLGNPPFGHFGEASIREWFSKRKSTFRDRFSEHKLFERLYEDFLHFDGNPQGFRMATSLQWVNDEYGYNLTYTQLASTLKYPWTPQQIGKLRDGHKIKKASVFHSEENILAELQNKLNQPLGARHPLTYLMEAADDISYCLSDIEDALEKRIVRNDDVIIALRTALQAVKSPQAKKILKAIPQVGTIFDDPTWFVTFRTTVTNELVARAGELYIRHHSDILEGKYFQLLSRSKAAKALLEVVKTFSEERLYTSTVIRERELVGSQVTCGILDKFQLILELSTYDAVHLLADEQPSHSIDKALAYTLKSFLPKKHLTVYKHHIKKLRLSDKAYAELDVHEWMARAHLITDYLAGMTDDFAIVMYRKLYGGGAHQL